MKKVLFIISAVIMLLMSAACGKIEGVVQTELAKIINERVSFSEPLTRLNDSSAQSRYFLSAGDYSEMTAYVGTKATCDEFVIVKTNDTDNAVKKISSHLTQMNTNYSSYRPDEAAKTLSPMFKVYKDTVVMVVTSDTTTAETVFEGYIKGEILP